MKAKFKLRGLMNVSGFHVDPGFNGRLKFAVYNAGNVAIDLEPGQRLFLIWYCDLDRTTGALYAGEHQGQDRITPEDVNSIRGIAVSPAGIAERMTVFEASTKHELERIEDRVAAHESWTRPILTGIALGPVFVLVNAFAGEWIDRIARSAVDSIAVGNQ
jgi:dCTP deaminase